MARFTNLAVVFVVMIRNDKNFPLSEIPDYDDIFKDEDDEEEFDEDDGDEVLNHIDHAEAERIK